jgi:hypothetical protein
MKVLLRFKVDVHKFKFAPTKIAHHPLCLMHKDEIKTKISKYNKIDTKCPIFMILEDP